MTAAQILAVILFAAMFLLIVSEKIERHVVSLVCGLLMLVLVFGVCMKSPAAIWNTLSLQNFFSVSFWYEAGEAGESSSGINWSTILFIAGMMLMVEGMGKAGFFRWLCLELARLVKYRTVPLFIVFMVMSSILAMFIDSITVILFLAAATVELGRLLKFNPVPMIIAEIFCANLGGSATMCGDPPNIIIGTSLGYSFADFITNTGVIAGFSLILVILYFFFCFRRELEKSVAERGEVSYPNPKDAIENRKDFAVSSAIFAAAVVLLVTHAQTGLTVAAIGVFIGAVTLVTAGKDALWLLKKVDYKTLLFFIGLFVVVGGLEQTGILELIAGFIARVSGDNAMIMVAIVRQSVRAGLGAVHGDGFRRQRNAHRSVRQRGGHFRGGQGGPCDRLGKILQIRGARHGAGGAVFHDRDLRQIFLRKGCTYGETVDSFRKQGVRKRGTCDRGGARAQV